MRVHAGATALLGCTEAARHTAPLVCLHGFTLNTWSSSLRVRKLRSSIGTGYYVGKDGRPSRIDTEQRLEFRPMLTLDVADTRSVDGPLTSPCATAPTVLWRC